VNINEHIKVGDLLLDYSYISSDDPLLPPQLSIVLQVCSEPFYSKVLRSDGRIVDAPNGLLRYTDEYEAR
jgi:hypothetical protein